MRCVISKTPANGLTRMEVVGVIAVLALLAIILPCGPGRRAKEKARQIQCVSNLKQVGFTFLSYPQDHPGNRLNLVIPPTDTQSQALVGFFRSLSNELKSPRILWCRADATREQATNWAELTTNHISYLLEADFYQGQMPRNLDQPSELERASVGIISGDRNLTGGVWGSNRVMAFSTNSQPKWGKDNHQRRGNLAITDGHVAQTTDQDLSNLFYRVAVSWPPNGTFHLAFP